MVAFWITCGFIMVLSSSPAFSCKNDRSVAIQRVTTDADSVQVHCPDIKDDEENVSICLYKDKHNLHSTTFQRSQLISSEPNHKFHVSIKNNTVRYLIRKPWVNDSGLYSCTVLPKSAAMDRKNHTILEVADSLQTCPHERRSVSWLLLTAGCGLIAFYNLIITIVACSFGYKLKHVDTCECDYYNTKPGEFKRAK